MTRLRPALVLALLVAAACSPASPSLRPPENTHVMTPAEARSKLTALLDDTFSAITPPLKFRESWPDVTENDIPKDTANVSLDRFVLTRVSQQKYGALLGLIERRWKQRGLTIESANTDVTMPAISARAPDNSTMQLIVGAPGNITITANVNPITLDPHSTTGPYGPRPAEPTAANGNLDIIPTIDDPFWSH